MAPAGPVALVGLSSPLFHGDGWGGREDGLRPHRGPGGLGAQHSPPRAVLTDALPSPAGAQGPTLAQPPERGLFAAVPPVEDPLESLPLQGALQVGGQDVRSVRAQRVRPAPTDSWMLESTVLTIPGQVELDPAEELPRRLQRDSLGPQPAHRVAPGAVPLSSWGAKGLPAFKGRYRVKVTPIASVGHSQSAEEIPQSDTTEATVIMMPEGSELPDGAPKST